MITPVSETYTQIGNVGTNAEDMESERPFLNGFIVREHRPEPSNWRSRQDLDGFLREHGVPAIAEIDTRERIFFFFTKKFPSVRARENFRLTSALPEKGL